MLRSHHWVAMSRSRSRVKCELETRADWLALLCALWLRGRGNRMQPSQTGLLAHLSEVCLLAPAPPDARAWPASASARRDARSDARSDVRSLDSKRGRKRATLHSTPPFPSRRDCLVCLSLMSAFPFLPFLPTLPPSPNLCLIRRRERLRASLLFAVQLE